MGGEVTRGPRAGTLHPRAHLGPSAVGGGGPRTVLESRGGNGGRWGGQAHVASRDPGLRRELRAPGVSLGTSSAEVSRRWRNLTFFAPESDGKGPGRGPRFADAGGGQAAPGAGLRVEEAPDSGT